MGFSLYLHILLVVLNLKLFTFSDNQPIGSSGSLFLWDIQPLRLTVKVRVRSMGLNVSNLNLLCLLKCF